MERDNGIAVRFGKTTPSEIISEISNNVPVNTVKTKTSAWTQFENFCAERGYTLTSETITHEMNKILTDYGFNMKKKNGEDYKESSVKSLWNTTAQMLQEKYFKDFGIKIDPFSDIVFSEARKAKDTKRKLL
ncbi:hypothetical protein PV326_013110, partial [Microctonus aethiopoides]